MTNLQRWSAILVLFFIAWPARPAGAQQISYHRVEQAAVEDRLKGSPSDNPGRQKKLRQLFEAAGCKGEALMDVAAENATLPNVVCKMPGQTDSVIVVGAHFDRSGNGSGVVDNWTGAALLPSLFESLSQEPRRHIFLFIGFTDGEKDRAGSKEFLKQLTPWQRSRIQAMINLDVLGLSPAKVWLSRADKGLAASLNNVAHSMKVPLTAVNADQMGPSDSDSFAKYKIPGLTLHSVTQETFPILHTEQERLTAIHMDEYYDSYRLVAAYLSYLDQQLAAAKEEAPAKRIERTSPR